MPLDHYISQVHLKNFYSPALGKSMYGIRKSDLQSFKTKSEAVCRISNGSTNNYLTDTRAIETFLSTIEPNYNNSLNKILSGEIDKSTIYVLSGFIAYISICSPTGMRLHSEPLRTTIRNTAEIMDSNNLFAKSPPSLGGKSLSELLLNNTVGIDIDPKYPQAIGIASVNDLTATLGNFYWEFLINNLPDNPFFTSDYPIAIEEKPLYPNRVVPLSPNVAVRIIPNIKVKRQQLDFSFPYLKYRKRQPSHSEIRTINSLIVRSAENNVFYSKDLEWVESFVKKNRNYRVDVVKRNHKTSSGMTTIYQQKIIPI